MSNKEDIFTSGPNIEVEFKVENGIIQAISLYASNTKGLKWRMTSLHRHLESQIQAWLSAYSKGEQPFVDLPLNWEGITPFTTRVLRVIEAIPFSSTLSYKQIANMIQNPKGSRAVGGACGRNPFPLIIPCHRVLTSKNAIGGFSEGIEIKKRLLEFENKS